MTDDVVIKLLFICSMNRWRSPTAEAIYQNRGNVLSCSRGINRGARRRVTSDDLKRADIVFVMEQKHRQRLLAEFPDVMRYRELYVLDIPDDYRFMDEELIGEIQSAVDPILRERLS